MSNNTNLAKLARVIGTGSNSQVLTSQGGSNFSFADAAASSGIATAGTLTKTFSQNEESTITLSSAISPVPNVSVFKDAPQVGVSSKGAWDVNSTASNYTRLDEATSVTLTPSAVGSGTFSLGSGSFASSDIGKTITGNGGVAVLTSAAGAYVTTTDFTNTNAIASGAWNMYGTSPNSDGSGLSLSGTSSHFPASQYHPAVTSASGQINTTYWTDINGMTADETAGNGTLSYAVSTDNHTTWSVAKGTSGVRKIAKNNSGTWQYNNNAGVVQTVGFDISQITGAGYQQKAVIGANPARFVEAATFNSDGTKLYVSNRSDDKLRVFTLSTAYNISTLSASSASEYALGGDTYDININATGTKLYMVFNTSVKQYTLSTAHDVSTASVDTTWTVSSGARNIKFNSDGSKIFLLNTTAKTIAQHSLSNAYDLSSTISLDGSLASFHTGNHANSGGGFESMNFSNDGTKLFYGESFQNKIFQKNLGSAFDVTQNVTSGTTYQWDGGASRSGSGTTGHASSIFFNSDGTRVFFVYTYNGGSYNRYVAEFLSGSAQTVYSTNETWVDSTSNNELSALQQSLTAQAFNRMDKAQIDGVADANHFALSTTLDLMISPYMASGSTLPKSDGVSINYDAAALIKGAINGTDYEAEFPSSTSVKIKSLAAQNLKVRVL